MKIFLAALMLIWSGMVAAESASVIDNVNVRSGKGENYRSLRVLPAQTEVEVIESSSEGYTKIKASDGQTGWVKSSFLNVVQPAPTTETDSKAAPAFDIVAAQKEIRAARDELAKTQTELEQERTRTKGEPQRLTLYLIALAAFVGGAIVGALLLRTYYLRRLHGLRI